MLLILLFFIPIIGGLISWYFQKNGVYYPKRISLFTIFLNFLIFFYFVYQNYYFFFYHHRGSDNWIQNFTVPWIPKFGIEFHLAADNLSVLMIFLSLFLSLISIFSSWNISRKYEGFFYFNLLFILGASIGLFLADDLFLFFFFLEVLLFPVFFLILFWGKDKKDKNILKKVARKFFIYGQISGFSFFLGALALVIKFHNVMHYWTFNLDVLKNFFPTLNLYYELFVVIFFFLSFLIKMPVVPFHSWFIDLFKCAPTSGSVEILGVLLKTAVYGFLRFHFVFLSFPAFFFPFLTISIGLFTIFYSSFLAFSQKNIKKLIAYSSLSHMGLILTSMFIENKYTYEGILIQTFSSSLCTAALCIISSQLYERFKTDNMEKIGNIRRKTPYLAGFFLFFIFANAGIPGSANFIGELMMLLGIFLYSPSIAILSSLGLVFSTFYGLKAIQSICFGNSNLTMIEKIKTISIIEYMTLLILFGIIVFIGVYPKYVIYLVSSCFN